MLEQPESSSASTEQSQIHMNSVTIMALFARMDPLAMAVATGVVVGLSLFLATAILLLTPPPTGETIGPNLSAISIFLPGYSVSWAGSALGLVYGIFVGGLVGLFVALLWNFTHIVAIGIAVLKGAWLDLE